MTPSSSLNTLGFWMFLNREREFLVNDASKGIAIYKNHNKNNQELSSFNTTASIFLKYSLLSTLLFSSSLSSSESVSSFLITFLFLCGLFLTIGFFFFFFFSSSDEEISQIDRTGLFRIIGSRWPTARHGDDVVDGVSEDWVDSGFLTGVGGFGRAEQKITITCDKDYFYIIFAVSQLLLR